MKPEVFWLTILSQIFGVFYAIKFQTSKVNKKSIILQSKTQIYRFTPKINYFFEEYCCCVSKPKKCLLNPQTESSEQ